MIEQSAQPSSGHVGSSLHFSAQSSSASSAIHVGAPLTTNAITSASTCRSRVTKDVYSVRFLRPATHKKLGAAR